MKLLLIFQIFFLLFAIGCSNGKSSSPVGEKIIRTGIDSASATTDTVRKISENTGILAEEVVISSSNAIKEVVISLEKIRKEIIRTFGQSETNREMIGPVLLRCPYCKRIMRIEKIPAKKEQRKVCPHCSKEMIIRWVD